MFRYKEGIGISVIAPKDGDDFVAHLYNYIDQKNDNGAALLKYVVSYVSYVSAIHFEMSYSEQEDVQQEIAIKLLCQGRKIGSKFTKRLLYVMIRNQCIDQQRKKSRQLATFVPSNSPEDEASAPAPDINDGGDVSLLHSLNCLETIFNCIEREPTGESDISIYTHYAFGLSHNEIATHTKRTAQAIAKRLSILRGKLKKLKDEHC